MSQYGAYGYAKHGKGYRFILAHYYTGTTIGDARTDRTWSASCSGSSSGDVGFSGATSACGQSARPRPRLQRPPGRQRGQAARRRRQDARRLRRASCAPPAAARIDDRRHRHLPRRARGRCRPTATPAPSTRSTRSPVDQYVKGVIPNESPPSWPLAALRAQAVAVALLRPLGQRRRQRLRPLRRHPQPGLQGARQRDRAQQRRRRSDPGPGGHLRGQDRRDLLLGLLGRPHRERPERLLRPADPLPGRRPRPLRRRCPLHSWTLGSPGRRSAPGSAPTSTGG